MIPPEVPLVQSSHFNKAFKKIILLEGGYSNHPLDSGGKTCYGITEKVARAYGYTQPMHELSIQTASQIYFERYWQPLHLEGISACSYKIAEKLFDAGVNIGIRLPARWLQQSLNALNNQEKRWHDLTLDSILHTQTLHALTRAVETFEMEVTLLKALNCLQGSYYIKLTQRREKDEAFLRGWLNHRITL